MYIGSMRILIDLDETQISELDQLARERKVSRAALMREAVADFLERNVGDDAEEAFGLWAERNEDGLAFQERVRSEW